MKKNLTNKQIKIIFKKVFYDEFDDPNESFQDFLLDLIPREKLIKILLQGDRSYYYNFSKYK